MSDEERRPEDVLENPPEENPPEEEAQEGEEAMREEEGG
jgi:hypothetical protein